MADEEELTWLLAGGFDMGVDRLTGMLGQFEPDGLPGLPLAHYRAVDGLSMRSDVLDLQADHVATAQLAVDG
jgi:hypothetical protein